MQYEGWYWNWCKNLKTKRDGFKQKYRCSIFCMMALFRLRDFVSGWRRAKIFLRQEPSILWTKASVALVCKGRMALICINKANGLIIHIKGKRPCSFNRPNGLIWPKGLPALQVYICNNVKASDGLKAI